MAPPFASLHVVILASIVGITAPAAVFAEPAPVAAPLVTAAPKVGEMWAESSIDESRFGLVEEEFFFEGTTTTGVPYKSRMIVRRPQDARRFNGTVVVEWMNASSGSDLDVDYMSLLPLIQREGYAYVAVTAQQATVKFLGERNRARYGTLHMTDDQPQNAAFEVFSQAGQALRSKSRGVDPLGGLKARVLIATGQSQSSGRLTTFVNSVHGARLAPVYDAVLLHSGGGAPTSFPLPILKLNSENEAPGYFGSRGVTNARYRYWEVPGTAHQPNDGTEPTLKLLSATRPFPRCPFPYQGAGGPVPIDPVMRAGVRYLDRWVRTGEAMPAAPLIEMDPATEGNRGVIRRDRYGNALGGMRMPQLEAPTGRSTPSTGCQVDFGGRQTTLGTYPQFDAFDGGKDPAVDPADTVNANEPASPKAIYKTHEAYVAQFVKATEAIERQGFVLKFDAEAMKKVAASSDIAR